jgi:hypothetical protein
MASADPTSVEEPVAAARSGALDGPISPLGTTRLPRDRARRCSDRGFRDGRAEGVTAGTPRTPAAAGERGVGTRAEDALRHRPERACVIRSQGGSPSREGRTFRSFCRASYRTASAAIPPGVGHEQPHVRRNCSERASRHRARWLARCRPRATVARGQAGGLRTAQWASTGSAAGATCGVPDRISSPQTIAPAAKIAADHQNAVV